MSARQLCLDLERLGVTLTAVDGRLRVSAPTGAVTPDLRRRLHEARDELLAALPRYRWRVVLPDGPVRDMCFLPEVTAAEVRARYPEAVVINPAESTTPTNATPAESA